jgi:hypothetical protein
MILLMVSSINARLLITASARSMQDTCTPLLDGRWASTDCKPQTQFCGSDNQCHDFSCQEWFQNGQWNQASIGSTTLACEDYHEATNSGEGQNYAVVYGCQARYIPEGKGFGFAFNRKCSATVGTHTLSTPCAD